VLVRIGEEALGLFRAHRVAERLDVGVLARLEFVAGPRAQLDVPQLLAGRPKLANERLVPPEELEQLFGRGGQADVQAELLERLRAGLRGCVCAGATRGWLRTGIRACGYGWIRRHGGIGFRLGSHEGLVRFWVLLVPLLQREIIDRVAV
jgi:hypothetical protein